MEKWKRKLSCRPYRIDTKKYLPHKRNVPVMFVSYLTYQGTYGIYHVLLSRIEGTQTGVRGEREREQAIDRTKRERDKYRYR